MDDKNLGTSDWIGMYDIKEEAEQVFEKLFKEEPSAYSVSEIVDLWTWRREDEEQ